MSTPPQALIFGFGFTGQALAARLAARGWDVSATARTAEARRALITAGVRAVDPLARDDLLKAVANVRAILITAPPGPAGCPGLNALIPALASAGAFPDWIGYLSTTGVYGDRGGGWVFEDSALTARSPEGARRVAAERDWLQAGRGMGLTVQVFRLPGIYGPGRSAFDRLREGRATRVIKPGQVFGRVHVDDIASALDASIQRPRPGGVYNICDDEPSPPQDVIALAAGLLGVPTPRDSPFDAATLAPAAARFYGESKRVSNARAKAELGWRPAYPSYCEGLVSILSAETAGGAGRPPPATILP